MRKLIALFVVLPMMFAFVTPVLADHGQPHQPAAEGGGFGGAFTKFFGGSVEQVYDKGEATDVPLEKQLPAAIGSVINVILSLIGIIMLVLFVYAGILWLTAGGNNDQVSKAKLIIKNAVIGAVLALAAFIITSFVVVAIEVALESDAELSDPQESDFDF